MSGSASCCLTDRRQARAELAKLAKNRRMIMINIKLLLQILSCLCETIKFLNKNVVIKFDIQNIVYAFCVWFKRMLESSPLTKFLN